MISFAVQAHPSRAEMAAALAARMPGCDVVFDPEPDAQVKSPWRTYRTALERTPPAATHRVIVQDDAELCPHFVEAATAAILAAPDKMIVFFVAGSPSLYAWRIWAAADTGDPFIDLGPDSWVPVVGCSWPATAIRPGLAWVDEQGWPENFCSDDEITGRICREIGLRALATVPSLVEHPDVVVSSIGRRRAMAGADLSRIAACYIGDECDARTIDWGSSPHAS